MIVRRALAVLRHLWGPQHDVAEPLDAMAKNGASPATVPNRRLTDNQEWALTEALGGNQLFAKSAMSQEEQRRAPHGLHSLRTINSLVKRNLLMPNPDGKGGYLLTPDGEWVIREHWEIPKI